MYHINGQQTTNQNELESDDVILINDDTINVLKLVEPVTFGFETLKRKRQIVEMCDEWNNGVTKRVHLEKFDPGSDDERLDTLDDKTKDNDSEVFEVELLSETSKDVEKFYPSSDDERSDTLDDKTEDNESEVIQVMLQGKSTKTTNYGSTQKFPPRPCPYAPMCEATYDSTDNLSRHLKSKPHSWLNMTDRKKEPTIIIPFLNRTKILDQCPFCFDFPEACNADHFELHLNERQTFTKHGIPFPIQQWDHMGLAIMEYLIDAKKN